jgi:hypothetical protein
MGLHTASKVTPRGSTTADGAGLTMKLFMLAQLGAVDVDEVTARADAICLLTICVAVAMVVFRPLSRLLFISTGTKDSMSKAMRNMEITISMRPIPRSSPALSANRFFLMLFLAQLRVAMVSG